LVCERRRALRSALGLAEEVAATAVLTGAPDWDRAGRPCVLPPDRGGTLRGTVVDDRLSLKEWEAGPRIPASSGRVRQPSRRVSSGSLGRLWRSMDALRPRALSGCNADGCQFFFWSCQCSCAFVWADLKDDQMIRKPGSGFLAPCGPRRVPRAPGTAPARNIERRAPNFSPGDKF
jgi:hypothetical protein